MQILFNLIHLHNTLLLISGTNDGAKLPRIGDNFEKFTCNDKAALFSPGNLTDHDNPIRILVGELKPKNTKVMFSAKINTDNSSLYIGDIFRESFLTVGVTFKNVVFDIATNFNLENPIIYVYIKNNSLKLIESRTAYDYKADGIQEKTLQLGAKYGCHICGIKNSKQYIPHLLPPLELNPSGEKEWYPVCPEDFERHKVQLNERLGELV